MKESKEDEEKRKIKRRRRRNLLLLPSPSTITQRIYLLQQKRVNYWLNANEEKNAENCKNIITIRKLKQKPKTKEDLTVVWPSHLPRTSLLHVYKWSCSSGFYFDPWLNVWLVHLERIFSFFINPHLDSPRPVLPAPMILIGWFAVVVHLMIFGLAESFESLKKDNKTNY